MSYTDYLKRMAINTPRVIDTQMRYPDASAYTWRVKLAATAVNQRTAHVITNVQNPNPAPTMHQKQVMSYPGSGFGGRVQDASSYTLAQGASALNHDTFRASNGTRRIQTVTTTSGGHCLTRTPASQVVSELGNAENKPSSIVERTPLAGLNMGYMRQRHGGVQIAGQVGQCTSEFHPQS